MMATASPPDTSEEITAAIPVAAEPDLTTLTTCVNCGFADVGTYCSNCGQWLTRPGGGAIKSFLHDITPLLVLTTLWRILIKRRSFFKEYAAGDFAHKSRPAAYALTAFSLLLLAFNLSEKNVFAPGWRQIASELAVEERAQVIDAIAEVGARTGAGDQDTIVAILTAKPAEDVADPSASTLRQVFGSDDPDEIALVLSARGFQGAANALHRAHRAAVRFSSYIQFAMPFVVLVWITLQALSQHFFINSNRMRISTTIGLFCYFYGSMMLCGAGLGLVVVGTEFAEATDWPLLRSLSSGIALAALMPAAAFMVLTLSFFRTTKEIMGAGYARQIFVSWFVAPLAASVVMLAVGLLIVAIVWLVGAVLGLFG